MKKPSLKVSVSMIFLLLSVCVGSAATQDASRVTACTAPEYRQFDFWLGDWDTFDIDTAGHTSPNASAHIRVNSILGSCVLHEQYEDPGGLKGESFTIFDSSRDKWHQSWVTNRGQVLVVEGAKQADEVVLLGASHNNKGEETRIRATWKPVDGGVRETALKSSDDGRSWIPWFDLMFRPRASASDSDDAKAVAALDTEYQAAVKKNDAAAMDRLLADDFILVTGSGKSYTKTNLVEDARAGTTSYEHNEDTEQKVRVWGDTAVVTAKLWEKGTDEGKPFDHTLWFSDTYVRTPAGWRYVFGQSSIPLPKTVQ